MKLGLDNAPPPADPAYRALVADLLAEAHEAALQTLREVSGPSRAEAPEVTTSESTTRQTGGPLTPPRKIHPWKIERARRLGLPIPTA